MSKYDCITVNECLTLNESVGITFNINDGHVTSINTEEAK